MPRTTTFEPPEPYAIGYSPNPSDWALRRVAEYKLWLCDRKEYLAARKDGTLDEWLDILVRSCRTYAEGLLHPDMNDLQRGEIWNMAVRSELLGSESD
ncbi:MAG: hypothetical protein FJ312_10015 [SAR202 cluster bacterium]|nr:hypothetical protein [SAR202 cluster bacterium]